MIVIDTNVLSAFSAASPDARVLAWMEAQDRSSVWTTAVTIYEVRFGLELLPLGRRRSDLEQRFAGAIEEDMDGRILPFDIPAAESAAALAARRRRKGRPVEIRDTQIAGIALSRNATLATRNVRHFRDLGVALVDPWEG